MRIKNKLLLVLLIVFGGLFLTSCDMSMLGQLQQGTNRLITRVAIDYSTVSDQAFVGSFNIYDVDLAITYSDGITEYIDINTTMISPEDVNKLNTPGTHSITVNYNGYSAILTIELKVETAENVKDVIQSAINATSLSSSVTTNFTLPVSKNNVNITWSSNSANIVISGKTATVTRSTEEDITVTLTGTFTYKGETLTKTFTVVVKKKTTSTGAGAYTGDYYDTTDLTLVGEALKAELRSLMLSTHQYYTSYKDCKTYLPSIDEDLENSSNMILFYTGESIKKSQDLNNDWNREHVWCQSLGWFTTEKAGSDLHHIRPCSISVNSARGNKLYGTRNGMYTPTDEYKGDVARIIFYLMVAYSESDKYSFTSIAESKELLLAWNALDPVSEAEMVRNDKIEKIQGNRNPFIDYSYLADAIWG